MMKLKGAGKKGKDDMKGKLKEAKKFIKRFTSEVFLAL